MEFRLPKEEEREQVEALWAYCFEPKGHPFFEWYFANCYEGERILVGVEDGQVLANVHLRPYRLFVRDRVLPVSYIVGLATHPAARRGGVGGELLLASLKEMRRRGEALTILMPSKAGFYQPYGWELYCHQWKRTMALDELRPLTERTLSFGMITSPDQWEMLARVYEGYTKALHGYAVRSETDWRRLISGQLIEGAAAVVLNEHKEPEGYLFYQLGAPTVTVGEFVYSSARGQRALLNFLYNHRSQGEEVTWQEGVHDHSYIFYPDGKKGNEVVPFMTMRVVDVQKALELLPVSSSWEGTVSLEIRDGLAPWNNGIFDVSVKGGQAEVSTVKTAAALHVQMDVGALALLLVGRLTANDLSFAGRLTGSEEAISVLGALYPPQQNYINEWY